MSVFLRGQLYFLFNWIRARPRLFVIVLGFLERTPRLKAHLARRLVPAPNGIRSGGERTYHAMLARQSSVVAGSPDSAIIFERLLRRLSTREKR